MQPPIGCLQPFPRNLEGPNLKVAKMEPRTQDERGVHAKVYNKSKKWLRTASASVGLMINSFRDADISEFRVSGFRNTTIQ